MAKIAIDVFTRALIAAYEADPAHSLRGNLRSVTAEEWRVRPANPSTGDNSIFGNDPVLSVCDLVKHVAFAKFRYGHLAFGDLSVDWEPEVPRSDHMDTILSWLEDGHRMFLEGVAGLAGDSDLAVERTFPSGRTASVERLIFVVINHDLYHSGEINRQVSLIRGADGWERPTGRP
jgi:hypothetical protein